MTTLIEQILSKNDIYNKDVQQLITNNRIHFNNQILNNNTIDSIKLIESIDSNDMYIYLFYSYKLGLESVEKGKWNLFIQIINIINKFNYKIEQRNKV